MTATKTSSGTVTSTTNSAWDSVTSGSIPLNIDDATTTSSGTTNASYIYGDLLSGGTAPVEQITTTGSGSTAVFLVANQTGVQGVYGSTGSSLEQALYSVYGKQTLVSGSDVTPFGFQGSYTDSTGLIYLINRYYDPTTDQFLSVDPDVATTDQPYVFTNDDPLNAEDPLGLCIDTGGACETAAAYDRAQVAAAAVKQEEAKIAREVAADKEGLASIEAYAKGLPAPLAKAEGITGDAKKYLASAAAQLC